MRISDWSSDVCSSDLLQVDAAGVEGDALADQRMRLGITRAGVLEHDEPGRIGRTARDREQRAHAQLFHEIGRASCRERVCQYVSISVVAVSLKKQNKNVTSVKIKRIENTSKNK